MPSADALLVRGAPAGGGAAALTPHVGVVSYYFQIIFSLQVVEVLTDALTLPETPVPAKAARLLLVSDVLHNRCATPPSAARLAPEPMKQ